MDNLARCSDENKIRKFIARPSFAKAKILYGDLAAIHTHKTTLKLNYPVYVGMSILDISKHLMFSFHYNHLKVKYGEECNLPYTDTDSLLLEIKQNTFQRIWLEMQIYTILVIIRKITFCIPTRIKKL